MIKLLNRSWGNYRDRTVTLTAASLTINGLLGVSNLLLGMYLLSGWFITNAVYYLLLCTARVHAVKKYSTTRQIENIKERYNMEFSVYRRSGIFLCLLGISYLLVCLRMYFAGGAVPYSGYAIFMVALIAFAKMGFSIYGTIITRHLKDPIVSTMKIINFTDAMVSIVVTQYTLLTMTAPSHASYSSALFGMGCSVLFIFIGIFMLAKKRHITI